MRILHNYAARYEQLLVENRTLHLSNDGDAAADHADHDDHDDDDDGRDKQSSLLQARKAKSDTTDNTTAHSQTARAVRILSNHAAMEGILQTTIKAAKASTHPSFNGDSIESIRYLLEETLYCNDYGLDAAGQASQYNKNGSKSVSLGETLALAAIEQQEEMERSTPSEKQLTDLNSDLDLDLNFNLDLDSENEADAFFDECPECLENEWNHFEVENEDFNDENDTNTTTTTSTDKLPLHVPPPSLINAQGNQNQTEVFSNQRRGAKRPQVVVPVPLNNPYAKVKHANANAKGGNQHNAQSKSWDAYNARNEDPTQQHLVVPKNKAQDNPFRTAKEFKNSSSLGTCNGVGSGGEEDMDVNEHAVDNNHNHNQNHNHNHNQNHNHNHNHNHCPQPHNPHRPSLSAGLKRKFQTPKPRIGSNNNDQQHGRNTSSSNSNTSRGSHADTNNYNQNQNHSSGSRPNDNNAKEDDSDLPEELKGLDKELITKIENEIVDSGDPITFKDIAGLQDAKQTVMELVCWPMKRPDLFTGLRRGPNGLLLFGPPGTGKTLIGKAIAHESGATFFSISSSSLTSKWIGEGEKLVRTLFAVAAYREPAVVFIDEIDSLLTQRKADENEASRRIKTEFLVQLDGTGTSGQGRVLAIGATNRPHELDDAARRRFVKRLYIPLPESSDREVLLRTLLVKNKHSLSDKEISKLSSEGTNGFSGADLKALCTDAALGPIRQLGIRALEIDANDVPPISYRHFRHALKGMNPSVAQADLVAYIDFNQTYGSRSVTAEDYDGLSEEDSDGSEE